MALSKGLERKSGWEEGEEGEKKKMLRREKGLSQIRYRRKVK